MHSNAVHCDGNGCTSEVEGDLRAQGWLRLMVVGGHPHEVFDFCPSCAGALRALMPMGPEPPSPVVGPEPDPNVLNGPSSAPFGELEPADTDEEPPSRP
jgi:hypothetical protein